uniref:Uncharacterized protein n=1 Tax=Tanacetum cinerariifolium TaxID=118510 RepID=A0A6L2L0G8_TANCI|nr:hypothetical protein [Tanacetum cinerariifolium]
MVILYISCAVDPQSNTPLTHILLQTILEVLQIGIRAEAIENQVKNVLLDYNHFENIALVKKGLHGTFMHTFMHMLVAALVAPTKGDQETYHQEWMDHRRVSGPNSTGLRAWPEEPEQAPPSPVYIPYVLEPVYPEYIPLEDDVFPAEGQPLPAAASHTAESPGYIPESGSDEDPEEDDDEDPEEDPTDYPTNHDDDDEEEEPSGDDADEEQDKDDDDDEEEEHPASAYSIPPPPALRYEARESSVAAAARPIEGRRADYGFVDFVEAEIRRRRAEDIGYGIRDTWDTQDIYGVMEDTQGRQTEIFQRVEALVDDSQYHYKTGRLVDQEARCSREAWAHSIGLSSAFHFELQRYMTHT